MTTEFDLASLLGEAAKLCLRDDGDAIRVGRDHRVETAPEVTAGGSVAGAGMTYGAMSGDDMCIGLSLVVER